MEQRPKHCHAVPSVSVGSTGTCTVLVLVHLVLVLVLVYLRKVHSGSLQSQSTPPLKFWGVEGVKKPGPYCLCQK